MTDGGAQPDAVDRTLSPLERWSSRLSWTLLSTGVGLYLGVLVWAERSGQAMWSSYLWIRVLGVAITLLSIVVGVLVHGPARRWPWLLLWCYVLAIAPGPLSRLLGWSWGRPWDDWYFFGYVAGQFVPFAVALVGFCWIRRPRADASARLDIAIFLLGYLGLQVHAGVVAAATFWAVLPYRLAWTFIAPLSLVVTMVAVAYLLFVDDLRGRAFVFLLISCGFVTIPSVLTQFASPNDPFWLIATDASPLCTLPIAAAALHPSMTRLTEPSTGKRPDWTTSRCVALALMGVLPLAVTAAGPRPSRYELLVLVAMQLMLVLMIALRARSAVTGVRAAEEERRRQAHVDPLTGMPNRLAGVAKAGAVQGSDYGIALADLDGFKAINDTHGYQIGDLLLREVGRRLQVAVRSGAVMRMSADEFLLFYFGDDLAAEARETAARVRSAMSTPIEVEGRRLRVGLCLGLADTSELRDETLADVELDGGPETADGHQVGEFKGADTFARLLRRADLALNSARRSGHGVTQRYTSSLERRAIRDRQIAEALIGGSYDRLLEAHFQAQVDLQTEQLTGAEALLRMSVPGLGQVSPAEFIPIAERSGQILALGEWILTESLGQLANCRTSLPPGFRLSVNVSPVQLRSASFTELIERVATEVPDLIGALTLEITESTAAGDQERAALDQIARLGIKLAIDDFGAEYASLQYLTTLPIQTIKIDRGFVSRLLEQPADRTVVRHVLALARDLGITVVAEGVECVRQADLLRDFGCQQGQGYLWDRPAARLDRFVERSFALTSRTRPIADLPLDAAS